MRRVRKLQRRVNQLESEMAALRKGGVVYCTMQQVAVTKPGGATGYITEGPRTGRWSFDGARVVIELSNQGTA